jgi:glycosyltransferase involved in cell wall biosynthesis
MRLIFVNSARRPGGGPAAAARLARGLAERGHQVVLACHPRGALHDEVRSDGRITVAPVAIKAELNPLRVLQLARLFRVVRPDLVLADRRKDVKLSVLACRLVGGLPLVHRHGAPSTLKNDLIYRLFWTRGVHAIVVNSNHMRERMLAAAPWLRGVPIRVIHNGCDTNRYRPRPDRRVGTRGELGMTADAFVVSFHGVLQERKNVDLLLRAVARCAGPYGVHALVVGDGPARTGLEGLAGHLGVHATFTGLRDDIPELLSAADSAAHLSDAEGFSNSVIEAMACGLPVIASDATSHGEQIEDGVHGLLVTPGSADAVARAVRRLASDREECLRMGRRARSRVEDEFGVERMIAGYEACMRDVVRAYPGRPAAADVATAR